MPFISRYNLTKLLYTATAIITICVILRLPGGPPLTVSRLASRAIRVLYVYLLATCFDVLVEAIAGPLRAIGRNSTYWWLKLLVLVIGFRLILRLDRERLDSGLPGTELPDFEGGLSFGARLLRRPRDPEGAVR